MAKFALQPVPHARLQPQDSRPKILIVPAPRIHSSLPASPSTRLATPNLSHKPLSLSPQLRRISASFSDLLGTELPCSSAAAQSRRRLRHRQHPPRLAVTVSASSEPESEYTPASAVRGAQAAVEVLGPNSRRVSASVDVQAPLLAVWSVLTDYYRLADYVPSLAKNEVLELREKGARLLQVGEQDVALGLKFQAKVVVDVEEEPEQQLPFTLYPSWPAPSATQGSPTDAPGDATVVPFSVPVAWGGTAAATAVAQAQDSAAAYVRRRAIQFVMKEGDFAAFTGRWVLQEDAPQQPLGQGQDDTTTLTYSVDVTPHFWLPVALVESRIVKEIGANLASVAAEACRRASLAR